MIETPHREPLINKSIRWRLLILNAGLLLIMATSLTAIHMAEEKHLFHIIQQLEKNHQQSSGHTYDRQHEHSIIIAAFILTIGLLAALIFSKRILDPIADLTHSAEAFASGDFNATNGIRLDMQDEIGTLSRSFVKMADHVRQSQVDLTNKIEEIKRTEEKLSLFFNYSSEMLGIADFDTNIIQVNDTFLHTLGYSRHEVEGHSYLDLVHPDDLNKSIAVVAEMREGHNITDFENRFRRRDGAYRLINWSVATHIELSCIYAIGRDITEQRKMEESIIAASEQAQERIARDLHDGLGQVMTGLAYKAKLIEGMLLDGVMPTPQQATELVQLANQASSQARSLARGLDPIELQQGLTMALEFLAHSTRDVFGIQCTVEHDLNGINVEKSVATHLFRIAQEAVNNAVRHSRPKEISLYLARDHEALNLVVLDKGGGVYNHDMMDKGQGIRFMQHRAKIIGGKLSILPSPGGGVMVKCGIPCKTSIIAT